MTDRAEWFERPQPGRTGPMRSAGHYFREAVADGKGRGGRAVGGIPLNGTEAAVVAAVRMAYKVAEAQVDRSARLARRLREAGDDVTTGARSDRQALDATEQLVFRAMMSLLGWTEAAAADNGNPLRRLFTAQYRLLGAMLGLLPSPRARTEQPDRPETVPAAAAAGTAVPSASEAPPRPAVRVQHVGPERRHVQVVAWEYAGEPGPQTIPVKFYNGDQHSGTVLEGKLVIARRSGVTLKLETPASIGGGRWKAALCDGDGVQLGHIEIVL